VRRRQQGAVPLIDEDAAWIVRVSGLDPVQERAHEAVLNLADGRIGSNGAPLWRLPAAVPRVLAAGVYIGSGPETTLVAAPVWQQLDEGHPLPSGRLERALDLHTGVLRHLLASSQGNTEAAFFSSLARPGTVAFRLAGPDAFLPAADEQRAARSIEGTPGGVA